METANLYCICCYGLFKFDKLENDSTIFTNLIKRERKNGEGFCLKYIHAYDDASAELIYEVEYGEIFCK